MDPIIKLEYRFENNQLQRLMLLPEMQQALHILQMPALELKFQLEAYLEENPLILIDEEEWEEEESEGEVEVYSPEELDFTLKQFDWMEELAVDEDFSVNQDFEKRDPYNRIIDSQHSLKEHLLLQLRKELSFDELVVGELIVGYLEENGYLYTSIEEICKEHRLSFKIVKKVLKIIQTFEPYGIGASSLQESLLIQLRCLKKEQSLSFKILDKYYEDVLHNRVKKITRNLKCSLEEYRAAIREISSLNFHLANSFSKDFTHLLIPDVILKEEEENLKVIINDEYIPMMRLNPQYIKMLRDETAPLEAKTFIQKKLNSFRWLLQNIERRNQTLIRITEALSKYHRDFFCSLKGFLSPLTMKTIAYDLNLSESTIVRAVNNKILCCSRGCIPIREFFIQSYVAQNGKVISSHVVKEAIKELIFYEDKKKPLTDEEIHHLLNRKGINCARRTIVKYRALLGFPSSKLRFLE